MIRLRVLGGIEVRDEAGEPITAVLAQPRRLALLAYLALADGDAPRRRDSILALFWPDRDQEGARAALNKAVHFLRRALGSEAIVTRGADEIGVDRALVWCDGHAFRQAIAAGDVATAMSHRKGELLPGFFVDRAQPLEEWIERERADLRHHAGRTARRLAGELERSGELTAATDAARQAVEIAVDDELAVRYLITLLDRIGDRAGALREYERFATHLRSEFSAEPSAETRELMSRVLAPQVVHPETTIAGRTNSEMVARDGATASASDVGWKIGPVVRPLRGMRAGWMAAAAVVALIGVVAFAVKWRDSGVVDIDPRLIVVAPFGRSGGHAPVDSVGVSVADRMTVALLEADVGRLVPSSRVHELMTDAASPAATLGETLSRRAGAGRLVTGSITESAGRVELRAELLRMPSRRVLVVAELVEAATREAATDSLRERLAVAVAAHRDWGDDYGWGTDHRLPHNMAAYRAALLADEANTGAEPAHWLAALQHDPSWPRAIIEGSRWSDSLAEVARRQLPSYAEGDQDHARYRLSVRSRDWEDGHRAMQRRMAADSVTWAHPAALMSYWTERLDEAVRYGARRDLHNHWTAPERRMSLHQQLLSFVLHSLGRFDEELALAAEVRTRFPTELFEAVTIELQAYAGLGNVTELERLLTDARGLPPNEHDQGASFSRTAIAAQELVAHGNIAGARRIAELGLPWFRQRMQRGPLSERELDGYLDLLRPAQRWKELADAARLQIARRSESPWDWSALSLLTIAEWNLGRRDRAQASLQTLRRRASAPNSDGEPEMHLARALFAVGDSVGGMDAFRTSYRRGFWAAHSEHVRHRFMPEAKNYAPYRALTRPRS